MERWCGLSRGGGVGYVGVVVELDTATATAVYPRRWSDDCMEEWGGCMGSESVGVLLVVALEDGVGWTSPPHSACVRQSVLFHIYAKHCEGYA